MDAAFFHVNQNDRLVSLIYVSRKPFLDGRHSFETDITSTLPYRLQKKEKGNPVMLVFAPVTAVLDAAGALVLVPAVGVGCMKNADCLK